jgi:endonuclease/exonuclease/phosphatase family metal-dependent hydrolase
MSEYGHAFFLSEVDPAAIKQWASDVGFTAVTSVANTRGQAVALLIHPRLKVLKTYTIDEIASVQGIPDLRPALCADVEDTATGDKFTLVVVHLKSMRGGQTVTAKVRYRQCELLAQKLGSTFSGYIAGDWNLILDDPNVTDADPLKNAKFFLVYPNDHTPTQAMGSRIDGFFRRSIKHKVGKYQTRQYWKYTGVGRNFSDHALSNVICDTGTDEEGEMTGSDPIAIIQVVSTEEIHLAAGFSLSKLELLKRGLL